MTIKTIEPVNSLALIDSFKNALELVARSIAIKTIPNAVAYEAAKEDYKLLIEAEKELEVQYKAHPAVIAAKDIQTQKAALADKFATAKKYLKNTPMLAFERAEEEKRLAEERRLAAIAKDAADKETARLVAEQKKAFEKAEKERLAAEAMAAKAKTQADKDAALKAAEAAESRAEAARAEAQAIKADAAAAPVAVIVVEKTAPSVMRRTVPKFRIKDESLIPRQYFTRDDVKIGGVIRSLKANHGIPGVEYYEELA